MPIFEVQEPTYEIDISNLNIQTLYYYRNSTKVREEYNERYYPEIDQNWLVHDITERFMYDENVQSAVFGFAKYYNLICSVNNKSKTKYTTWWFITLTSKEEWSEEESKEKIDKYRESHFKKYKYIWVEEHGTESEKYHQHVLVDSAGRFHTQINLKSTKYYDGNINIKRVTDTYNSKSNIIKYMSKENAPQGCLQHFGLS